MSRLVPALVIACSSVCAASAQQLPVSPIGAEITYDDFIKSPPAARREQFRLFAADHKARIARTHAERWLAANRGKLSNAQIAVAHEAISFVTPQIYLQPNAPEIVEKEQRIKQKLTCVLGDDNTRQAFAVDAPPPASTGSTWGNLFDEWMSWFTVCLAR